MTLDLSCPDWKDRLRQRRSLIPDLALPNPAEGHRAVAIFNKLRLYDVGGTPTMAEAGGEWFRQIVYVLFAALDPVTKARLIQEIFLLVSKKQNKTTGGALLMLTALTMNQRPRAPFLMTAPFQKQANDAFAAAAGAIELDPVLEKTFHVRDHLKKIVHRQTKAELEILTFDPSMVTGKKVVGGLIDELHVLGKMPRANKAMIQLRGGMTPFPEAFLVTITTQSDEAPAGVFLQDLTKAREIRDGKRTGATLPVLYEFPREMQQDPAKPWLDPANWPMVTPNEGLSIRIPKLVEMLAEEQAKGEAEVRVWASQHLNIEIGLALSSDGWVGAEFWESCADPTITLESLMERCEVVVPGIDGGGLDDLLGFCVMGRERGTGRWLAWFHAWAHRKVLERRKDIAPQLLDFEKAGELGFVDDMEDAVKAVVDLICKVSARGLLPETAAIGVDANGIKQIYLELIKPERGIKHEQIIAVSQGHKLMSPIKTVEVLLAAKRLLHNGTKLMNFCVGNAKVEDKGNAILITKAVSGKAKIDPLMAGFDCVELLSLNPKARVGRSFWETAAA